MTIKNFTTMGTFGDTVYSLSMVRYLGGGNLFVKLNALDDFSKNVLGWRDAGPAAGRLTEKDYLMIEPLLKAQDYINTVSIWRGEKDDYPQLYDVWKYHLINGWKGNLTECYALTLGLDISDPIIKKTCLHDPWLTPVEPIKIPNKPFVVNRTSRYLYGKPSSEWNFWLENNLCDMAVFVGTPQEHRDFENLFNCKIEYAETKNLLELAQLIQGCEFFIGNQSVALSIAIGLGKSYSCEIRKDYENTKTPHGGYGDTWFPRINGNYF